MPLDSDVPRLLSGPPSVPVEELPPVGRAAGGRGQDMRADLWDSNEEFDGFLADLRESRRADLH